MMFPYLKRNYNYFNEIVITKSFGYNLWRGNNIKSDVNGTTYPYKDYTELQEKIDSLKKELIENNKLSNFEIRYDKIFKETALKNILENKFKYLILYIKKFFYYLIFNPESNYQNYYNPLIFIPEIILSIFCLFGFLYSLKKNNYCLEIHGLYIIYSLLIPIFFILPRYKLFILPLIIYLIALFFSLYSSDKNFFKKTIK